ncbi:MAG TPA: PAC2 family protein [Dehalococcoidia bacterium]|jgi:predicted ATP-grasp superfamily ATP-dependent carboligase|nr:PAC2 family protein [Dehalococcoidia bacterium]
MTIEIGPWAVVDPLPPLHEPRMLVVLQPWIDVGSVGTMTLAFLGETLDAQPLAQLSRPGRFFDFTRYRPMLSREGGERKVTVPNARLHRAPAQDGGSDWILAHMLEPHNNGEEFVEGLIELVSRLGVREYVMIGSMYAPVPHTRRPVASGGSSNETMRQKLLANGVRESNYEGPTTILAIMGASGPSLGVETTTMILQLPAYAQVERDYMGLQGMLELLSNLYGLDLDIDPVREEADRQRQALDETASEDARLQVWLKELELAYDMEARQQPEQEPESPPLSPSLERFLQDVERRWSES